MATRGLPTPGENAVTVFRDVLGKAEASPGRIRSSCVRSSTVHNAHIYALQFILPTDAVWFQQLIKAFNSAFRWGQISKSPNV